MGGNTLAAFFYLKAHRPKYRDRLSIYIEQVQSDIDEMMERLRPNTDLLSARPVLQITESEPRRAGSLIFSASEAEEKGSVCSPVYSLLSPVFYQGFHS